MTRYVGKPAFNQSLICGDVPADALCLDWLVEVRIRPELPARGGCKLDPGWVVLAGPPLGPTALVKTVKDMQCSAGTSCAKSSHKSRLCKGRRGFSALCLRYASKVLSVRVLIMNSTKMGP